MEACHLHGKVGRISIAGSFDSATAVKQTRRSDWGGDSGREKGGRVNGGEGAERKGRTREDSLSGVIGEVGDFPGRKGRGCGVGPRPRTGGRAAFFLCLRWVRAVRTDLAPGDGRGIMDPCVRRQLSSGWWEGGSVGWRGRALDTWDAGVGNRSSSGCVSEVSSIQYSEGTWCRQNRSCGYSVQCAAFGADLVCGCGCGCVGGLGAGCSVSGRGFWNDSSLVPVAPCRSLSLSAAPCRSPCRLCLWLTHWFLASCLHFALRVRQPSLGPRQQLAPVPAPR